MAKSPTPAVGPDSKAPTFEQAIVDAKAVLSPEELAALLTAVTERREQELAAARAQEEAFHLEQNARAERRQQPLGWVGLADQNDSVVYVKLKRPFFQHERTVHLQGITYEHIREDEDDVWIYKRA